MTDDNGGRTTGSSIRKMMTSLSAEERAEFGRLLSEGDDAEIVDLLATDTGQLETKRLNSVGLELGKDVRFQLSQKTLPQKIKLALKGNAAIRSILIADGNKLLQAAVLENPGVELQEAESFARNASTSEFVLREIARNREWAAVYSLRLGLVTNPKTPVDLSVKLLSTIRLHDVKKIAKSKNLPSALLAVAKRRATVEKG